MKKLAVLIAVLAALAANACAEVPVRYNYGFMQNGTIALFVTPAVGEAKCGLIDIDGKVIVPPEHGRPVGSWEETAVFHSGESLLFFDMEGNVISELKGASADMYDFSQGLAPYRSDGRWGFVDHRGNVVIEPQFEADDSWPYRYFAEMKYGEYTVSAPDCGFAGGLAVMPSEGKYGAIDMNGDFVIPPEFDFVRVSEGVAEVTDGDLEGAYAADGSVIADLVRGYITVLDGGYVLVSVDDGVGLIDHAGNVIAEPVWDDVMCDVYNGGLYVICRRGTELTFIAPDGTTHTLEADAAEIVHMENGTALIRNLRTGYTFRDYSGDYILRGEYAYLDFTGYASLWTDSVPDGSGYMMGWLNNGFALFDPKGTRLTEPVYSDIGPFGNGLFPAQKDGAWGYIDINGAEVIDFVYEEANEFRGGLASVVDASGNYVLINMSGEMVLDCDAPELAGLSWPWNGLEGDDARFIVPVDMRMRIIDAKGNTIHSADHAGD